MNRSMQVTVPKLWAGFLALGLLVCSIHAGLVTLRMREAPVGCDPFGYLQAGQEFRQAYRGRGMPTFSIDTPQTRSLATYFTTLGIPLTDWEFVVGPHAYHYLPEVQRAISIYPPGAGWMLSLFPEGYAVRGWNLLTIAVLLVLGWAGIYWGKRRKAWVGMGLVALASSTGLFMLRRIGEVTYSTSLVLLPITASVMLLVFGEKFKRRCLSQLLAGALLGLSVLIRLPALFLVPGVLVWQGFMIRSRRESWKWLAPYWVGMLLFGALPLFVHQSAVTGSWHTSTYGRGDKTPASLQYVVEHFDHYMGRGVGNRDRGSLIGALGVLIALGVWREFRRRKTAHFSWVGVTVTALAWWGLPLLYFLTHWVATDYYPIPSTLAALMGLAWGFWRLESESPTPPKRLVKNQVYALVFLFFSCGYLFTRTQGFEFKRPAAPYRMEFAPELTAPDTWVWADLLSGTLWYSTRTKTGFKPHFLPHPAQRHDLYRYVHSLGQKQYLLLENESMERLRDEIVSFGGKLERRGALSDGTPYFLITW